MITSISAILPRETVNPMTATGWPPSVTTTPAAAASIDTGNARRDAHLRSADFFDSGNHPDITFTVDGIRPSGRGAAVTGALTVRASTWPLSFDAAASVQGDGEIWLDAEVHINRAGFGLTWNQMG